MGLIWIAVAGAAAGWIAGKFMKPNAYGPIGDIVAGLAGAFVSAILIRMFSGDLRIVWSVIVAIIGASILLFTSRRFMEPVPIGRGRRV